MSLPIKKTITCKCGNKFDIELFLSVNVTVNPELKEKVLKGEINSGVCPKCGEKYQIPIPFIYSDMDRDFMVEINPQEIGMDKLKNFIEDLEKKYTLEEAEKRRKKARKECVKIDKKIEKVVGIKSSEWLDLPYEEFMKVYKRFLEKEEENIDKKIRSAETDESKEKLLILKKKIEEMKKSHEDSK